MIVLEKSLKLSHQNLWLSCVALALGVGACAKRSVNRVAPQSLDASAIPFFVEDISPRIAVPGTDITITGYLFTEELQVTIADSEVELKSRNDSEIVLVAPDVGVQGGVFDLALGTDSVIKTFKIGINPSDSLPLYSGSLEEICNDQTVVNAVGEIVKGLRDCDAKLQPSPPIVVEQPAPVEGVPPCTIDGQSNCVVAGDRINLLRSKLSPQSIAAGVEIAGVLGTAQLLASPCSRDGQVDCTTNEEFPAVDSSQFQPENIRAGYSLAGVQGAQKFCKSGVNRNAHNTNGPTGSPLELDIYDTIDDQGARMGEIVDSPFGDEYLCNASNSWRPLEPDGSLGSALSCDSPSDQCMFVDIHSQIVWTEVLPGFATWAEAAQRCADLNWGMITSWRLPTQKEALQAYIDGIEQVTQAFPHFGLNSSSLWTATSVSAQTGALNHNNAAWTTYLDKGLSNPAAKSGNAKLRCIADMRLFQ